MKERGEYVEFREVHMQFELFEDPVASQANIDNLPGSLVRGSFSKP